MPLSSPPVFSSIPGAPLSVGPRGSGARWNALVDGRVPKRSRLGRSRTERREGDRERGAHARARVCLCVCVREILRDTLTHSLTPLPIIDCAFWSGGEGERERVLDSPWGAVRAAAGVPVGVTRRQKRLALSKPGPCTSNTERTRRVTTRAWTSRCEDRQKMPHLHQIPFCPPHTRPDIKQLASPKFFFFQRRRASTR